MLNRDHACTCLLSVLICMPSLVYCYEHYYYEPTKLLHILSNHLTLFHTHTHMYYIYIYMWILNFRVLCAHVHTDTHVSLNNIHAHTHTHSHFCTLVFHWVSLWRDQLKYLCKLTFKVSTPFNTDSDTTTSECLKKKNRPDWAYKKMGGGGGRKRAGNEAV